MDEYSREDILEALLLVSSTISKCKKMQLKFRDGTSQHTLLSNRIKALCISEALLNHEDSMDEYTRIELIEAERPITSIISKCEKAQQKFVEGTSQHTHLKNIIKAMYISKNLITDEISKRD